MKNYFVYILTNWTDQVIYIGLMICMKRYYEDFSLRSK